MASDDAQFEQRTVKRCRVCDTPASSAHYGAAMCTDCMDRVLREIGPGPEQLPVRRCLPCGGWVVRHDDVVPWRCTDCGELLNDADTSLQTQAGGWSA